MQGRMDVSAVLSDPKAQQLSIRESLRQFKALHDLHEINIVGRSPPGGVVDVKIYIACYEQHRGVDICQICLIISAAVHKEKSWARRL